LEIRENNLDGSDFGEITTLYPNLYKLKVGDNPINSLDVFKVFNNTEIRKLELSGTPAASATNFREELFKNLKNLEVVDNQDKQGGEVDSTIYDEEGDEDFDDEDLEGEEIEGEDFEDEEDEGFDDEEEEEESEKPKKKRN
jgi:hypothetical protein